MVETQAPAPDELGGKYRILADLGHGGTATVSLAIARGPSGFSKLVVLKVMKPSLAAEADMAQMFMSESRLAARLNHPNIVQTNEVFEHRGLPVIVMEYLEGQPLSSVLARAQNTGRLRLPMHLKIISDVLGGLHYSHELRDFDGTPLNVVHRDVSPHNVFVTFDGQVKLLDFGIAKLGAAHGDTEVGLLKGKIRYMAPEQVTNEHIDRRADVFAVGVMLWEAVTGSRMWVGLGDAAVMNRLLNGDIPSASSLNPEVDPKLERVVAKALAPAADDRWSTAAELQAALDEYLAEQGTSVRPREIGNLVSDLFQDVRAETQRLIEVQLSRVASLTDAEYARARPIELTNLSYTQSGTTRRETADAMLPRRRRWLGLAALLGLLAVAGVSWALLREQPRAALPPPPRPAPAAPAPVTPPEPSEIELRLTAFPAITKIYLDGRPLDSNPFAKRLPKDDAKHVLRFEAPGHEPEERTLGFDQDRDLVVVLEAEPAPAPTATSKPKPRAGGHKPKPARKANCDPPFVVDSRGVKRYKPECL